MSEQQSNNQDSSGAAGTPGDKKSPNWLKISVIANIVIVAAIAGVLATVAIVHQSDTNPRFCANCHIMEQNVNSYLTSNNLDNHHAQAVVQCKECHEYPLPAEIASGIKFITGNYTTDENGQLAKRDFGDEICTQCHISMDHVAELTDELDMNPHDSHIGDLPCSACHIAHGEQIDYCAQCHDSGDQEMIGAD